MSNRNAGLLMTLVALAALAGCGGGTTAPTDPAPVITAKQLTATETVFEANPMYAPDGRRSSMNRMRPGTSRSGACRLGAARPSR